MSDTATIIRATCWRHKVHPQDVMRRYGVFSGNARAARAEIIRRLHAEGLSLPQIGAALGGRHHTTILYYLRKDAA